MVRYHLPLYSATRVNGEVDLYGRGYSDAPWLPYDASLYTTQLALLMQHIKWERAHIAGLSMVNKLYASLLILHLHAC